MSPRLVRVAARVRGRVQGVAYRANAARAARRLGLTGWVRNEDDGSVALEAQGEEEAVKQFLAWCEQGPPAARVAGVDVTRMAVVAGETEFEIGY